MKPIRANARVKVTGNICWDDYIGKTGKVIATNVDGSPHTPFAGRDDIVLVDIDGLEEDGPGEFAPEELEVLP